MRIIACLALSIDGKITDASENQWVRLGSDADLAHLLQLRNEANAVAFGANTLRAWPKARHSAKSQSKNKANIDFPPQPVVFSRSGKLNPQWPFFQDWQADWPPILVVSEACKPVWADNFAKTIVWLELPANSTPKITVATLLNALPNTKTLLIEGGGEIVSLFLQAGALQELYLTYTPWLIGGKQTPGLLSGQGFLIDKAVKTQLISCKPLANELFVHLKLEYPSE